jgi:hypothetical protein
MKLFRSRPSGPGSPCLGQHRRPGIQSASRILQPHTALRWCQHGLPLRRTAVGRANFSRQAWDPSSGSHSASGQVRPGQRAPDPAGAAYSNPGGLAGDAVQQEASASTPSAWGVSSDYGPAADWGDYRPPEDWGEAETPAQSGENPSLDTNHAQGASPPGDFSTFGAPIEDTPPNFSSSSAFPGDSEPWPFADGFSGGFGPGQQNPYAPPPPGAQGSGGFATGPVMPSDITLITPRDVVSGDAAISSSDCSQAPPCCGWFRSCFTQCQMMQLVT